MSESIIKLVRVWKEYESVVAVKDLSYDFLKGKMYAIMGPSGSGKTTLINMIATLSKQTRGEIVLMGHNIKDLSDDACADIRNNQLGFVFQAFNLLPRISAQKNVEVPMYVQKNLTLEAIEQRSKALLSDFGLVERIDHYPKDLSAGEKQRVAIARALANEPDLLLADEPTGNLDEENEKYVLEILKALTKEGKTVVLVSHNPIVKDYADVVIQMSYGEVVSVEG